MKTLTLLIDNHPVVFYRATLTYSLEQLAHVFSCDIAPQRITRPLSVEFILAGKRIFSGFIDAVSTNTGSAAYSMSLSGRSKSANMIDSVITMDAQYNQTIESLLRVVSKDFGLTVQSRVPPDALIPIPEFQINAESAVDNFAQLIKEQGFMLIERDGVLTIENPAHGAVDDVVLEVGDNIDALELGLNFTEQFYQIEVQGQLNEAQAVVTYAPANTQRRKVIVSDQLQDATSCLSRATYERDLAIARGLNASATLNDVFIELTGSAINRTVRVIDAHQGFNETLLIKSITLSVSESAMRTQLEFYRPFKEETHA